MFLKVCGIFQTDDAPKQSENKKAKKEDFESDAKSKDGEPWNLKIVSWNVDGVRAWLKVSMVALGLLWYLSLEVTNYCLCIYKL